MLTSWKERLLATERESMTEKQMRMVIAAVELFGEQGYANTSTKEIAQRAQVSEGAIFKHYATKKDLLLSITQMIIHNVVQPIFNYGLEELFGRSYANLEEFMSLFLQNRLMLIDANIVLVKVVLQEAMFQPQIRQSFLQELQQSQLPQGLEHLRREGLLPDLPTPELLGMLLTGIMGYVFSRYIMMPDLFAEHREQDRENFARFMARGLALDGNRRV